MVSETTTLVGSAKRKGVGVGRGGMLYPSMKSRFMPVRYPGCGRPNGICGRFSTKYRETTNIGMRCHDNDLALKTKVLNIFSVDVASYEGQRNLLFAHLLKERICFRYFM